MAILSLAVVFYADRFYVFGPKGAERSAFVAPRSTTRLATIATTSETTKTLNTHCILFIS